MRTRSPEINDLWPSTPSCSQWLSRASIHLLTSETPRHMAAALHRLYPKPPRKKIYLFGGWLRNLPFDPLRGSLYFSPSGQVPVLLATTYECTFGSWLALGLEKWWIMTHKQTHTHTVGGAAARFFWSFFFFDAMASFFMDFWVSFDEVDNGGEPYRVKLHTYV